MLITSVTSYHNFMMLKVKSTIFQSLSNSCSIALKLYGQLIDCKNRENKFLSQVDVNEVFLFLFVLLFIYLFYNLTHVKQVKM